MSTGAKKIEAFLCGLTLAGVAGCASAPEPGPSPVAPAVLGSAEPPPADPVTAERLARRINLCQTVLLNADLPPRDRRDAAHELIDIGLPDALRVLGEALAGEPGAVVAVGEALCTANPPPPPLLEVLVQSLRGGPAPPARDWLARAVAHYQEPGLTAVSRLAGDAGLPASERLGPIFALGEFQTRAAAAGLIEILKPPRQEPPEVAAAACESLRRLNGITQGMSPQQWLEWWSEWRMQSEEEWLRSRIALLIEQNAEMTALLKREQTRVGGMEKRLAQAYRDIFPSLSRDAQLTALPPLLGDEILAVRQFAVGRIDRLLRDTLSIPEPLQRKLMERLDDSDPALRLQAARLLEELAYADIEEEVARRLATETTPAVVEGYIRILAKHPSVTALPALRQALGQPAMAKAAAAAIWQLALAVELPAEERQATCEALRAALASSPAPDVATPATAALAAIGTDDDVTRLVAALDQSDTAFKEAVASAFAHRGLRQPLLDRAADEVIYPYAVAALTAGERSLSNVRALALLAPPPALRQTWAGALVRVTGVMAVADVLAVDDLLQQAPHADAAVRRQILEPLADRPAQSMTESDRTAILQRLVPLMIQGGASSAALTRLDQHNQLARNGPLRGLHLEVALRSGAFDRALAIDGDPLRWVALLEKLAGEDPVAATALLDRMSTQFGTQLTGEVQARFTAAAARLRSGPPAGTASATTGGPDSPEPP